jgi:hypothetical protein
MRSNRAVFGVNFVSFVAASCLLLLNFGVVAAGDASTKVIRTAKSGVWSAATTWEGGKTPGAGVKVQIREGHTVLYDVQSAVVIRSLHIHGTLTFAHDRDTRLETGLIRITPGDSTAEEGFDCDHPVKDTSAKGSADPKFEIPGFTAPCLCCDGKAALLVGTPEQPISSKFTALIRLHYIDGMNKESCPAIVCCGGRMDFHGAPMNRTWVNLDTTVAAGASEIALSEAVTGWKVGDRIIVTATELVYRDENEEAAAQKKGPFSLRPGKGFTPQTEERTIKTINGSRLGLDQPLKYKHSSAGHYRGEIANLSRNVVVESADPKGIRGHTMYHRNSAGAISYAEFRHLGKEGVLGRYSIHYHLCRDTMRGSYVLGASIWDSHNRWITVHGTEYLVVRDCVGFQSLGHGFFLEDGTEVYNVFDRNLAVQAFDGQPLPKQMLPFDPNDGAGFWWANSLNTFTRNVAVEYDTQGFRFHAEPRNAPPKKGKNTAGPFDLKLQVRQPDGSRKAVDIRTLPFVRFDDNEAHTCLRPANPQWGLNMGMGNEGVGPDKDHPFVIRNAKFWNVFGAMAVQTPCVLFDNVRIGRASYVFRDTQFVALDYRNMICDGVLKRRLPGEDSKRRFDGIPPYSGPQEKADLKPVDDLPPITVITHVRKEGDKLIVRGATSDDGVVNRVQVNGQDAKSLTVNYAQWEAQLNVKTAGELLLTAGAVDAAGNAEKTPHGMTIVVR